MVGGHVEATSAAWEGCAGAGEGGGGGLTSGRRMLMLPASIWPASCLPLRPEQLTLNRTTYNGIR